MKWVPEDLNLAPCALDAHRGPRSPFPVQIREKAEVCHRDTLSFMRAGGRRLREFEQDGAAFIGACRGVVDHLGADGGGWFAVAEGPGVVEGLEDPC